MNVRVYNMPIGPVTVMTDDTAVTELSFGEAEEKGEETEIMTRVYNELFEYFEGTRKIFDLPLRIEGTPFQIKVWYELQKIPWGETRTYGEIAKLIGNEKACRAVGAACGKNPIGILIPCHRIIGANGDLTGFAGGIQIKKTLLSFEEEMFSF